MSFKDIAFSPASYGVPVFPLQPREKSPITSMSAWPEKATNDLNQIEVWDQECDQYNVGLVALADPGGFCGLEFDVNSGMKSACEEMGQPFPVETMTTRSGKGGAHYWFRHSARSIAIGNRQAHVPGTGKEWFSFRAHRRYLVGAGSTHPNGNTYKMVRDLEPIPIPDWVLDWIELHSEQKAVVQKSPVMDDDFDIEAFLEHYSDAYGVEVGDSFVNNGIEYFPLAGCPNNGGEPHSNHIYRKCCFTMGSLGLGFNCFADQCFGVKISDILRKLVEDGHPYGGPIWAERVSRINVADIESEPEDMEEELESEPEDMTPTQIKALAMGIDTRGMSYAELKAAAAARANQARQVLCLGPRVEMPGVEPGEARKPTADELFDLVPRVEPLARGKELQYPELVFPLAEVLIPGSNLEALVSHACKGGDGKPYVLDPGLVTEAILTLASGLPQVDTMLETRMSRYSALLAISRGGKGMAWQRSEATLGVRESDCQRYSPSGHVQMIYQLGDHLEGNRPNQTRVPGPRKMIWITEELSGCLKMAKSDGSKVMQQLLEFYDRNGFTHTDSKTGRVCKMDCRLSWGTCLAIGSDKIEERKFADTFTDVSNDGLVGRLSFGFSEAAVDSRDLEGWQPPVYDTGSRVETEFGPVDVMSNESMASRIAKHVVTGWEPGVFEVYRAATLSPDLEFPGWQYALKKTLVHIALVNLHEKITMDDFRAAVSYIRWQGSLRKVFRASQADDDKQARFNEKVIRALRKEDQVLAKKGKPVGERQIYVPRVAQRHEWALRGKSLGLDKTILELANMGALTVTTITDEHGKETRNWQRVRVAHPRVGCWCGVEHPKSDTEGKQA